MASLSTHYPSLPQGFLREVEAACYRLGIRPGWLMAIMDFETGGTFDPSIRNPYSGFTGLIQFGPQAAAEVGTTLTALSQMSRTEQLYYVEQYFRMRQRQYGPLQSLEDAYMAVLYPAAIGRSDGYVLFAYPSTEYVQNSGLDRDGDGRVTKYEAAAPVRRRLRTEDAPLRLAGAGSSLATVVLLSAAGAWALSLYQSQK